MRPLEDTESATADEAPASTARLVDEPMVLALPPICNDANEADLVNGHANGAQNKSLKQLATHSSLWTVAGYGCAQVLRLGSNLAMAKLLFPEAFGMMALVNGIMQGLMMFSDVGITQSIIRHARRDDPDFYNTAWTVQVVRGLMLTMGAILLAWPMGSFYDPILVPLTSAIAFTAIITGFTSTKLVTANRDFNLAKVIIIDLCAQFSAVVVMVSAALFAHSVWSFVIGAFVASSVRVILSHTLIPGPVNRFCWRREATHEIFRFGKWIFVSTAFTYLAMQSDKLILGRLLLWRQDKLSAMSRLGVYSVAFSMMTTVSGIFEQLSGRVLVPAFVHVTKSQIARFNELVTRTRKVVLMAAAVAVADLILLSPTVFRFMYDHRYQDAAWMTQLLGCGLWFTLLQRTSDASLVALGHSRVMAAANAANFFVTIILAPFAFYFFGIKGFIAGWTLGNLAAVIIMDIALAGYGVASAKQDWRMSVYLMVLLFTGLALQQVAHPYFELKLALSVVDLLCAGLITAVGAVALFVQNRQFVFVKVPAIQDAPIS